MIGPRLIPMLGLAAALPLRALLPDNAVTDSEKTDGVAGWVDNDVVLYSDVYYAYGDELRAVKAKYQGAELTAKYNETRIALTKKEVDRQVIIHEFQRMGGNVSEADVQARVELNQKQSGGADAFAKTLSNRGETMDEHRRVVRDNLIVSWMEKRFITEQVDAANPTNAADEAKLTESTRTAWLDSIRQHFYVKYFFDGDFPSITVAPVVPIPSAKISAHLERAHAGEVEAQLALADDYYFGRFTDPDYRQSAYWMNKAAQQGNARAERELAYFYFDGLALPRDIPKAIEWFTKAASQHDTAAERQLGFMYLYGKRVPQNVNLGIDWLEKAVDDYDPQAATTLAAIYLHGSGVPRDPEKAAAYGKKLADKGIPAGFNILGLYYIVGTSKPGFAQAAGWFQKGAFDNDAVADGNLAACYAEGKGVPKNLAKAIDLCRKGAMQGDLNSEVNLANFYEKGQGFPKPDREQAIFWYGKAAAHGNHAAAVALQRLNSQATVPANP